MTEPLTEDDDDASESLPIILFLATCATTFTAGALMSGGFDVSGGLAFSATIMSILLAHELGHYIVARRHGIAASLPYFIPLPPFISLGTMGAVIRMREPIRNRDKLLDVAIGGPLAGMVVAVPLVVLGLELSSVGPVTGGVTEGNSILYALLKYAVFGQWLPNATVDVQLHPVGFAAWVGFLITMINLIPIGQLDGGHVAKAVFGDAHDSVSRWLHLALLVIGLGVVGWAFAMARGSMPADEALVYAGAVGLPWLVWALLLVVLKRLAGGEYHPDVDPQPLSPSRRRLVVLIAIVFVAIFTPVPLRENLVSLLVD